MESSIVIPVEETTTTTTETILEYPSFENVELLLSDILVVLVVLTAVCLAYFSARFLWGWTNGSR